MIQETFLEAEWDDAITARRERDARLTELQAQGFECKCEDLVNLMTNQRVFTLEATEVKQIEPRERRRLKEVDTRPKRVNRTVQYEER